MPKKKLPELGEHGFGSIYLIPERAVMLCRVWIRIHCHPRKTINKRYSSYWFKHKVEREDHEYIPNGAFIKAAMELGYRVVPDGPNAFFNIEMNKIQYLIEPGCIGVYCLG